MHLVKLPVTGKKETLHNFKEGKEDYGDCQPVSLTSGKVTEQSFLEVLLRHRDVI